ncbi:MAG TPA: ATP-binding protein [Burkholderiales bacterium]|nr:ATP-binding protein [Burkholderiales bacterium]
MISIRRRLLAWLLAGVAAAVAVGAVLTYLMAREQANELADYQLQQLAMSFRDHALASGLIEHEGSPDNALEVLVQIWNREGLRLYISHPRVNMPDRALLGFTDVATPQGKWRVFSTQLGDHVIQVAQPQEVRNRLAAAVALRTVWPLAAMLPLLGLLIWFTVGRGLSPLERLAREVRHRSPAALEPIPENGLPNEVRPLVGSLNDLLRRLGQAIEAQRALVADAAHELRSPLTAVRLQAQIAERAADDSERREALGSLGRGVERASHLVQQLLTLAREEGQQPDATRAEVRLDEIAREVVAMHAPLAQYRGLDLGLERTEPLTVAGNLQGLRTLLSNLVDNALRYTPSPGSVDVGVWRDGEDGVLQVRDTGPGVPADERARVFDRFYRRAESEPGGSGLGLAIARRVVEHHRGSIELDDNLPTGLRVTVRLPLDTPQAA